MLAVLASAGEAVPLPRCRSGVLLTQNEAGLFVVAAAYGFGFSGIIPAYVVAVRDLFPSAEASWRVPLMLFTGMSGMAFGSWFAGRLTLRPFWLLRPSFRLWGGVQHRQPGVSWGPGAAQIGARAHDGRAVASWLKTFWTTRRSGEPALRSFSSWSIAMLEGNPIWPQS